MKSFSIFKLLFIPAILLLTVTGCKKTSSSSAPLISTTPISAIDSTVAMSGGNVFSDGGETVTTRGVCWSTNTDPTITDNKTNDGQGTGTFTSNLTGLTKGTLYYVRAYATNASGTSYGQLISFSTLGGVVGTSGVVTLPATNITANGATLNGTVDASVAITDVYFEYGLTNTYGTTVSANLKAVRVNPVNLSSKSTKAAVAVTADITGLGSYTTYFFRLRVSNTTGTTFGNGLAFTTTY